MYQRIVELKTFYRHKKGKHCTVVVHNGEAASCQSSNSLMTSVRFVKFLLLLKVKLKAAHKRDNETGTKKSPCSAEL